MNHRIRAAGCRCALAALLCVLGGPGSPVRGTEPDAPLIARGMVRAIGTDGGLITFQFVKKDLRFAVDLAPGEERDAMLAALNEAQRHERTISVHFELAGAAFAADRSRVVYRVQAVTFADKTLTASDPATRRAPGPHDTPTAEAAFIRGGGLYAGGRFPEAITALDAALEGGDFDWKGVAHKLRGLAIVEQAYNTNQTPSPAGDRELLRALEDLRAWQRLRPDESQPLYNIGHVLEDLGAYPEARELYRTIGRRWQSEALWSSISIGVVEREQGHYTEALAALDKLVAERGPQNGMAYHYHRAWTLTDMGQYSEAVSQLAAGLESQPDYPWALFRKSCAEALLGRMPEALADQQAGLALLRRFADGDLQPWKHDLQRATQIEAQLRNAAAAKQTLTSKDLCSGFWHDKMRRARSELLPAHLEWLAAVERGPPTPKSAEPPGPSSRVYVGILVTLTVLSLLALLLRSRKPNEPPPGGPLS